jgi:hypothetical protein
VHRCRFRKANRATHETLDASAQIDMFALDFLCILLANVMLRWVDMPFVRPCVVKISKCINLQKITNSPQAYDTCNANGNERGSDR